MIYFPKLVKGDTIAVTAPSSGVEKELHHLLKESATRMEERGYKVEFGETVWSQKKASSAPATKRALEFNHYMKEQTVQHIVPPWGGELLIEMIEFASFKKLDKKWILGYSDSSVLLLAMTLKTGLATAHGTNFVDLRGKSMDDTTAKWIDVLSTEEGGSVVQYSSEKYQKEWDFENPTDCVFNLTEPTEWKTVSGKEEQFNGRLLGGCIDVIRHLIGTPYGDVKAFREHFMVGEPVVWYFENCDMKTTDLRRTLVQMRLAGWFDDCAGIMFGRSSANQPVEDYTVEDVYKALAEELDVPVVYDIDCGHVPPQLTFINGALAEVSVRGGKGRVEQWFK
ncbi:S66 family peptidase [Jeotgalibacillus proteolyticus]|uniref:LD-carboxypeptidase n=1 Tax=Jeotgalibacillus proteolyticus TaxID=2082395 RepID=A0A2S5GCI1_9BACL|nr:S66 peptidase family protein [Jeotgalibacillus proteolyticus]PPA70747.1 LD-carboxypeptidase [Jeotgalibacillus proteolyticus]